MNKGQILIVIAAWFWLSDAFANPPVAASNHNSQSGISQEWIVQAGVILQLVYGRFDQAHACWYTNAKNLREPSATGQAYLP